MQIETCNPWKNIPWYVNGPIYYIVYQTERIWLLRPFHILLYGYTVHSYIITEQNSTASPDKLKVTAEMCHI
jgi:hypothetical protein